MARQPGAEKRWKSGSHGGSGSTGRRTPSGLHRRSDGGGAAAGAKKGNLRLKKEKTKYHKTQYQQRRQIGSHGKNDASQHSASGHGGRVAGGRPAPSHRTADIDIQMASKVSAELRESISIFKNRRSSGAAVDVDLEQRLFRFVTPQMVMQHLPSEVMAFRSYLSKFQKGESNVVSGFLAWFEWASYEASRGASFSKAKPQRGTDADQSKEEDEEEGEKDEAEDTDGGQGSKKRSQTRQVMARTLQERSHMRALVQMCLRHNAEKRKQGQHAFLNHLKAKLAEEGVDSRTLEHLRATVHHSVIYALSRLLLGMVTDNFAMLCLHCSALFLVLKQTDIPASVVLQLMDEEFALEMRMRAVKARLEAQQRKRGGRAAAGETDGGDESGGDDDGDDGIDPDEINDPTKGERNQRLIAAVFAMGAVVASAKPLSDGAAAQLTQFLSFAYVEQKTTRVTSANLLLSVLSKHESLMRNQEILQWMTFAFFHYPKMEYFRPEAIQLVLYWMEADTKPLAHCLPATVQQYIALDPLQPAVMEQIGSALFRKEQVTACHPMLHPVWTNLFDLVVRRSAMGESLKEHLTSIVHTLIAPYRRGSADIPRRALFQNLVSRLGQIAVQSDDVEERVEVLRIASTNVGYGKRTTAKPTPMVELKWLPISALHGKVEGLLRQYRMINDGDPAAVTNRTWVLRELRNCLYVPVREGVEQTYVNEAVKMLLMQGFFPSGKSKDTLSQNRCIYLFSDVYSFSYTAALARPKATVSATEVIAAYLAAEGKGKTRYSTALQNGAFRKARNRIVEALEAAPKQRSVLFYDNGDMELLLALLFLVLSVDDPSNSDAVQVAKSVVPDLAHFYAAGTLETLDLFLDALMALLMRVSSPLHVMPLMTSVRRIATGFILKFARFIKTKSSLDILLAPLRDAYHTDSRELARQRAAKKALAEAEDEGESGSDVDDVDGDDAEEEEEDNSSVGSLPEEDEDAATDADTETNSDASTASDDASTASDDVDHDDEDGDADEAEDVTAALDDEDEEEEDALEEEEAPTQEYVDALKTMVGNVDLDHAYPTDTASKEKSDVVRAISLATRVGLSLRSPVVLQVYQVLLAVCRENIKSSDDVIFQSTVSSIEMLLLSKHRYFGSFVSAAELFQLLGDIQSYARKMSRVLVEKDSASSKAAAVARKRLAVLKKLALRVFHFTAMLAYKNHGSEEIRITLSEYYKSIFCDRGWDTRKQLPNLKNDMYHYRLGFAWVMLPATFEKYEEVAPLPGPQRVRVFTGCCALVEAMLPRLSGLPRDLKATTSQAIRAFLQAVPLAEVYDMKHTLPYNYLHAIKMVLQYNNRVQLDASWVATAVVGTAVENDDIQLSAASIRLLAVMERILALTPRAKETKAPVPVKVLYQQFEKQGTKEKSDYYRRAKRVRGKILKALLAHRNDDATDEQRAVKRRRKEEMKIEDRVQRQVLRESRNKALTKEEREEKRRRIVAAKQERIAKNRLRKRRLHEMRQRSFERWRQAKLSAAVEMEE